MLAKDIAHKKPFYKYLLNIIISNCGLKNQLPVIFAENVELFHPLKNFKKPVIKPHHP